MWRVIRDYFAFNRAERNGLVVLSFILLTVSASYYLLPLFVSKEKFDFSAFEQEISAFEKTAEYGIQDKKYADYNPPSRYESFDMESASAEASLRPFEFDPNEMTPAQWKALGMTDRQIRTLTNYVSKGGRFRSKDDFRKMYCISDKEFSILEPFIKIPEQPAFQKPAYTPREMPAVVVIEINSATVEDFDKLDGIGNYFATQIVEYRNKLGGFTKTGQILEVPKMDSARFMKILPSLSVNPKAVRRLNVNTASFDELKKHPYIGYNIALSLTNYRDKHGKFQKLEDIKKSALVTEKVYARISPYLRVD